MPADHPADPGAAPQTHRSADLLTQEAHRLHEVFEQLPSISVQGYDQERRVIFWNPASELLYGYRRDQALGRRLEDLIIPPPMRDAVIHLVQAWVAGGPAIPAAELILQRADGQPIEVFSSHVMLRDAQGQAQMYCIDIDISERKRAERALSQQQAFLRAIIDELPEPLVLKDEAGRFLLGNQAVARLYNTTPQAMVGRRDDDFGVPPDLAERMRRNVLDIMARGQTEVVFEDSRDAASGEIRHYRSLKKPFRDAEGRQQILVVAQDLTDLVRAQQQVMRSEQRLQQVLEITREGIWDWHLPSGRVEHNRQWYDTLGFPADETDNTVAGFTALIHPEDRQKVQQRLQDALSGERPMYFSEHRLLRSDGQIIWVQDRGRVVERDAQGQAVRVVGSFTDISFQKAHQHQLEHLAHYDALTGLPNRVLLADRMLLAMAQARRRGQQLAVAYLDLDGFKQINDLHGHTVGDQLLSALANQFKAILREGDTVARLGGDEFVAVFVDICSPADCQGLIERLLDVASRPADMGGLTLKVSASIGVSFFPQSEDTDADQLLRQADQAMYSAKLSGKNRFHLFDAAHDRDLRARTESVERLRQALARQEMVLYYQPKVNLRNGHLVGAEALIRWQHPQRGLLSPGLFLPDVENDPVGIALGEWVLDAALRQILAWQSAGLCVPVSVNISAHQLQQRDFSRRLRALLAAHPGVQRDMLELEVLETSALEDLDAVAEVIRDCADMGVGFALDDFGTGYASLTYLKRLPAQVLKIDQSFVRDMLDDPQDLAIVEGVLGLARAFHRLAVAEGAETPAHCHQLLRLGCELAQGYGIARPMPADSLPDWLQRWRPDPAWQLA